MGDLAALRKQIRARRRAIVGAERALLSSRASAFFLAYLQRHSVASVGAYLSMPEEIDTAPLIAALWADEIPVYLPVVVAKASPLVWRRYMPNQAFTEDVLGMQVPLKKAGEADLVAPPEVVAVPLVGFDATGNRIGMGGGYYDRTFQNKVGGKAPFMIGFAYRAQQQEALVHNPWDVPLDCVITEQGIIECHAKEENK